MEPGPKNAKLGIERTGEEEISEPMPIESPLLRKENPPDAKQGVDGSARKEEKDDLQVNEDDGVWQAIGDPWPKLMSQSLDINAVENELPPSSHAWHVSSAHRLCCSGCNSFVDIHE